MAMRGEEHTWALPLVRTSTLQMHTEVCAGREHHETETPKSEVVVFPIHGENFHSESKAQFPLRMQEDIYSTFWERKNYPPTLTNAIICKDNSDLRCTLHNGHAEQAAVHARDRHSSQWGASFTLLNCSHWVQKTGTEKLPLGLWT